MKLKQARKFTDLMPLLHELPLREQGHQWAHYRVTPEILVALLRRTTVK